MGILSNVMMTDPRYGIESDCEWQGSAGPSGGGTSAEGGRW